MNLECGGNVGSRSIQRLLSVPLMAGFPRRVAGKVREIGWGKTWRAAGKRP